MVKKKYCYKKCQQYLSISNDIYILNNRCYVSPINIKCNIFNNYIMYIKLV